MLLTIISIIAFMLCWRAYIKIKKWDMQHEEIFKNEIKRRKQNG